MKWIKDFCPVYSAFLRLCFSSAAYSSVMMTNFTSFAASQMQPVAGRHHCTCKNKGPGFVRVPGWAWLGWRRACFTVSVKLRNPWPSRQDVPLMDKRHLRGHQQLLQRPAPPPPLRKPKKRGEGIRGKCFSVAAPLAVPFSLPPRPRPSGTAMAVSVIIPLLALASLGAAFAPNCDDLLKPYIPEDPKEVRPASPDFWRRFDLLCNRGTVWNKPLHFCVKVFGKWVYVMGAGDPHPYHKALGSIKSSWVELSPTSDGQTVTLRWGDSMLWVWWWN